VPNFYVGLRLIRSLLCASTTHPLEIEGTI